MKKHLFLLDAYALIFRAYYALIRMPRITSSGFNTSAIFGFVNTLEELLKKEKPTHIAVCFDPQGPTFRHEAFENYKGEREATPEDIKLSVPIIKEIVEAYNIPILEVPGFEADDVIGTISKIAETEGFMTYMMTPDKDFGQLVSPTVIQYKPGYRGGEFELRGVAEVCARYDISDPLQVIDLLALMGDKADNIPGCPGIGEKTAIKLIHDYGTVENLIANTNSLKGALKNKIEENKEQILFSKFLATIKTDVPVDVSIDDLRLRSVNTKKLFEIFQRLEFKSLIDRVSKRLNINTEESSTFIEQYKNEKPIQGSLFDMIETENIYLENEKPTHFEQGNLNIHIIDDSTGLKEARKEIENIDKCGLTIVADGGNAITAKWIGTAIALENAKTYYLPASYKESTGFVLDLLQNPNIMIVSKQIKFDYIISYNPNIHNNTPIVNYYDISVAHYLLQPETRHNIEYLASIYLHEDIQELPIAAGQKGAKQIPFSQLKSEDIAEWACRQAYVSLRLMPILNTKIKEENLCELLHNVEFPLIRVLAEMEISGVRIDEFALNQASDTLTARLKKLETEIHELAGENFNVSSPAKVGEILFTKLQLDSKAKKTKSGQYSTSEDVLEKIAHLHPIVGKILEFRQLKKLLSTYVDALPATINPLTGKIHTTYNQTITATGRISSSEPNLQNIPVRDDLGREVRRAFIADDNHLFLSADYSQIELRLVADFANDETMIEAFREGKDIHAITASKIYKVPLEEVTPEQRRNAKTANFGILYGISAFGLASRLSISRAEAKMLIDGYFSTFPKVNQYMNDTIEKAREFGYVSTILNRKRMLPDINSRNAVVRGYAERNAINAPIQGSAADIIKIAMVAIDAEIKQRNLKSKMIMQVHDELNFDIVPDELEIMKELVARNMENAYSGRVQLTASCGVGNDWLTAH